MEIDLRELTIQELAEGYSDGGDSGVRGLGGQLDIRPPYQREFIYKEAQRNAVIETVRQGFPLNVMYWADRGDGTFEIIDGQQRTISICQYVSGGFSIDGLFFHNLQEDQKDQIRNYPLMIYICEGTDSERLDWFRTINIAGATLTNQELLNAVYHGPWLSAAKVFFSRPGCPAQSIGNKLLTGSSIRQEYLETALKWINDGDVKGYMAEHQHDEAADDLWKYFRSVIDWTNATFTTYRKEMKGVKWGPLYNHFKGEALDPAKLEEQVARLMMDDEINRKAGIYPYLLTGEKKLLNLRAFKPGMMRGAFERQGGVCPSCKETFSFEQMEGDHKKPWSQGGKTDVDNCQMLCKPCNRKKGDA
jgi:hypothetical protein